MGDPPRGSATGHVAEHESLLSTPRGSVEGARGSAQHSRTSSIDGAPRQAWRRETSQIHDVNGSAAGMLRTGYPPERIAKTTAMEYELDEDVHSDGDASFRRSQENGDRLAGQDGLSEPLLGASRSASPLQAVDGLDDDLLYSLGRAAKSDIPAAIANMANSILGAGIIGLPYAVLEAGFYTGIFLLVALCAVTNWTIRLLVLSAKMSGQSTYIGVMEHCFGVPGRMSVAFFQFAFALGGMCANGVIVGDTVTPVLRSLLPGFSSSAIGAWIINRQVIITTSSLFVMYPLSLNRDIAKLSHASGMALVAMSFIVLTILIRGPLSDPALKGSQENALTVIEPRVFEAIGVISFAYVCHQNSHMLYDSLKTPTIDRFNMVVHISTGISLVFCLIMSVAGYLSFTDKTQANILNNLASNDFMGNLARFCIGMNMTTTLPLECFVCREVLELTLYAGQPFSQMRHWVVTSILCGVALLVALSTCDLGIVLEITGGLSATALAFVFPAICYYKLLKDPWYTRRKLAAAACASFGVIVMILSSLLALRKIWTGEATSGKICV